MKIIKIKINKPIKGYGIGDIVPIQADDKKIPLERYWRMRLRDSKIDNCISIVTELAQKKNNNDVKK